ncbi:hypothetical protein DB41_IT00010, partial [Neochlamydia sp. TUME1]
FLLGGGLMGQKLWLQICFPKFSFIRQPFPRHPCSFFAYYYW